MVIKNELIVKALIRLLEVGFWDEMASAKQGTEQLLSGINVLIWIVVGVTLWSGISFIWNNRKEIFNVR